MIHECLLKLWNCPELDGAEERAWMQISELEDFLHPGEKKLLKAIIDIAMDYHKINAFNRSVLHRSIREKPGGDHQPNPPVEGLYITAFCNGVHKVLDRYRYEIIQLEDMFLQTPQLPLTEIFSCVERFRNLFQTLLSMIKMIQEENVHGCLLIGRLHKYVCCGVDQIVPAAEQIIVSMNKIFYRHLCNWIIYGVPVDSQEFFIIDGKVPDENFLYPEQLQELNETNGGKEVKTKSNNKIRRSPIVRKFYINWNMVPLFIDEDTAENILFMGRTVWIVMNDPKNTVGEDKTQIKYKRDVWENKETEYYKRIQELESKPFNQQKFQRTLETCRNKLTKFLWSVMINEGQLVEHLQLIRDYYALGRGELFQQFITMAEVHMNNTSTDSIIHSLNSIFYETARKMYSENDKTYLNFELTFNSNATQAHPWLFLQMNFEMKWPLHIVFHPKVMALYNKLFCFLLRLRKTQIDLNKLWADHIFKKHKIDRHVLLLRQNLMFLVNNLQYYLQVDVIEAQFSMLLKAVKIANEFEDIIKVHHEFITNLLAKTFVLTLDQEHTYKHKHRLYQLPAVHFDTPSKVYEVIIKLLDFCDEFCLVATVWNEELAGPELEEFGKFKKRSEIIVEELLVIICRLHEKLSGHHLLQLLLQLDFNKYFSKNKPYLNLSANL